MTSVVRKSILLAAALFLVAAEVSHAQSGKANTQRRRLSFSGLVDADFTSAFGSFNKVSHTTGLEADLSTNLLFSPTLNAQVRTTMRDGNAPRNGVGNTWASLQYDGAQINWKPGEKIILMAGDLVGGTGYFQYARYRRIAAVVGEHSLRGAGLRHGNIIVHTGAATDSVGQSEDWSVYAQWTRSINPNMFWSPSFRFTTGVDKAYPFELGVSFSGNFDDMLLINAHMAMNYWNTATDPGSLVLFEPRYTYDNFFLSAIFMHSEKGEVPAPNAPRFTRSWQALEDVLIAVEPGLVLDKTFSVSGSLEYRNQSLNRSNDESLWLIPNLYVYPAPRAEWRLWTGLEKPLASGTAGKANISLGSELAFTF